MSSAALASPASLKVVDLGAGLARLLAVSHFADLGCTILRPDEPAVEPFAALYPAYTRLRSREQVVSAAQLAATLAAADICILGGEDHPDLHSVPSAAALAAQYPRLVILEFSGGLDRHGKPRPAVDLLAQARSGLCFDQLGDRPFAWPLPMATFSMTLHGLIGVWAALIDRVRTRRGQIVSVSMQSGAAFISTPDRLGFERNSAQTLRKVPAGVRQMILQCSDGRYVQFAKLPGTLPLLYEAFGIPVEGDPATLEQRTVPADPRDFFCDFDLFSRYAAKRGSQQILQALWRSKVPADEVLAPGACWNDEQVEANHSIVTDADGVRGVGPPLRFTRTAASRLDALPAVSVQTQADLPLKGLRIVGLGAYIAGPAASRALADLGADVIKVDPLTGDPSSNTYGHWWACNSGKRSIQLDLKKPEAIAILHRLCANADVVHHNFRRGVDKRMGIDPDTLGKRELPLVTLQCNAYGTEGPKAEYPGFDQIALGITGNEVRAGGAGNTPLWYRNCIADYTAGLLGCVGLLVGLFERNLTGANVDVRVNLLDSGLYLMSELIQKPDGTFAGAPGNGPEQLGVNAAERFYEVQGGWLAIAARGTAMRAALLHALELPPDLFERTDAQVASAIGDKLRNFSVAEAHGLLESRGVWSEICLDLQGAAADHDASAVAAGLVYQVEDIQFGRVIALGPLMRLSGVKAQSQTRAPCPGEHTRELLTEYGFSKDEIDEYFRRAIVS